MAIRDLPHENSLLCSSTLLEIRAYMIAIEHELSLRSALPLSLRDIEHFRHSNYADVPVFPESQ